MKTRLLLNPFVKIAGLPALGVGLLFVVAAVALCFLTNTHFYTDFIPFPFGRRAILLIAAEQLMPFVLLSLALFLGGSVLSRSSIRFIDVVGTAALSRAPLVLIPLINISGLIKEVVSVIPKSQALSQGYLVEYRIDIGEGVLFAVLMALAFLAVIWYVSLLYNAYKISCNLTGLRSGVSFGLIFMASEALSFFTIYQIYHYENIPLFFNF